LSDTAGRFSNGMDIADLGERIRLERLQRRLSLEALAARTGVSRSMLSDVERGAKVPTVLVLDLAIYLQHVMFHAVPVLWRVHRMHHVDLDFDVTTGLRFHPIEIALSLLIKLGVVAALGASAVGVLIFEVLLNATSLFNHGNISLPLQIDRWLRWLVVTPDMHRVHHSIVVQETNSNFGFNLPWWDRLLGTYCAQPAAGHESMTIGIEQFRDPSELRLDHMLTHPLRALDCEIHEVVRVGIELGALVVAHGGSVRYEDTPGGGATFVCTFPREAPAA